MAEIVTRQVSGEELLETAYPLTDYAFYKSPTSEDKTEEWRKFLPYSADRYFLVSFMDGKPVATANNLPLTQNVRGKIYDMGGVAGVAVLPEARRRGLARQNVTKILHHSYEKGEVFSTLYPFRESFYERLGYVGLTPVRMVEFNPLGLSRLLKLDIDGEVERLHLKDAYDIWRDFTYHIQTQTHAMAYRDDLAASGMRDHWQYWVYVARVQGEVVGIMRFKVEGYGRELKVPVFYYTQSAGKYLLLQAIGHHADQTSKVLLTGRPTDYPEMWLTDLKAEVKTQNIPNGYSPTPMGRVVDVRKIGGMQVGEGASFTATIYDEQCEWNNGTFRFAADNDELVVEEASEATADCELSIHGLSALIYGVCDPGDFVYRDWGNPAADVQAEMLQLFPPQLTHLYEEF